MYSFQFFSIISYYQTLNVVLCGCMLSRVRLFEILWTVALQALLRARTLEWVAVPSSRGSS